jgi:ATP-binding cassette, subfamily B, bacterial PglK
MAGKSKFLLSYQFLIFKKIKLILTKKEMNKGYIFLVLMIFGMIFETLGIGLIAPMIKVISDPKILINDNYLSSMIQFLKITNITALIFTFSILLVIIYLIKNAFLAYFAWYKIHFIATLRMDIANRLFQIYLSKPYAFHLNRNSGQLIQNISTEVTIFTGRFLNPIVVIFTESLVFIGIVILLFFIEPLGALIVIISLGVITKLILAFTARHIKKWGKERQYHDGQRMQHLQQGLGGVKDVLLLGREDYFLNHYKSHNLYSTRPDRKQSFLQDIPRLWFEVLAILSMTSMIVIMTLDGRDMQSILSVVGVFAAAAFRLMPSITRILAGIQSLRYSSPVLDVLYEEFNYKAENMNYNILKNSLNLPKFHDEISISNLTFTYQNANKPSISNISLTIPHGSSIGIIGESGSGKSTLVDILLGLLQPDNGKIIVDNQNIDENIRSWQNQIGYVPQSIFLTDNSLRNNIAFGVADENIDHKMIDQAIIASHLSDFVGNLPEGLDTFVGERGVRLSGGQKQRIGIARALYADPDILVLDEASSSLDTKTEKQIMLTVEQLQLQKTIIIIAHRLSTIEKCDWIYRLENGKLVEQGKPSEIIN